jgi:hypothetical protein
LVDSLGGVGLHPVAGVGDALDPLVGDPGGVRKNIPNSEAARPSMIA